jgi:hypothetical protein
MSFQWDALLLEALLLCAAIAPWGLRDHAERTSPVARFAVAFLLARLLFRSGYVKLASGDPTWANLTALDVHFETQPLPTPLSFYARALPAFALRASTAAMLAIELGLPWLALVPRVWAGRSLAFGTWVLMAALGLTGNYGFFNLLTASLALGSIDDRCFEGLRRRWTRGIVPTSDPAPPVRAWSWRDAPAIALVVIATGVFVPGFVATGASPLRSLQPWHIVSNYGLFAVMTTERPEIVLQASDDGSSWREIPFRHKPGATNRAPSFSAPHLPRLDWQMWFAALGRYPQNPWLLEVMRAIHEGGPDDVLDLLGDAPIVRSRPRFVRAVLYDYRFTSLEERARTGNVWRREARGLYAPVVGR